MITLGLLHGRLRRDRCAGRRRVAATTVLALTAGLVPAATLVSAPAYAAPVGQGFNLNADDLRFILKQIKISEHHAAAFNAQDPCAGLVGDGPDQIPAGGNTLELPWGLRTVDGTCNNLMPGQAKYGAADQRFPRRVAGKFRSAEPDPRTGTPTSYEQTSGSVYDSQPRIISNLVVDQTAENPAAQEVAGPDAQADPESGSLPIPNVAPDVGLSAPFNSVFTIFGQFFDHGLDLVAKGGNGTVYVPLRPDDPLYDSSSFTNFMVVTRASLEPGTRETTNLTTPFVDQNQTYTSHPSHQVFLRDYALNAAGDPAATGRLLDGAAGGQGTWKDVKDQARTELGIALDDRDVLNVPLLATDPYGNFLPGPNGLPQLATPTGLVEGSLATPVDATQARRTGHAFLDDIAHHAQPMGDRNPRNGPGPIEALDPDSQPGTTDDGLFETYDDEMLDAHFVAGDGRVNENIALTAIHHVFHSEHNRLAGPEDAEGSIKHVLVTEDPSMVSEWKLPDGSWNGEHIFQAAKFVTEMEYQHLAFEEFARKVQPMVNPFGEGGTGYNTSINPAIKAEFAHAVYRFGHSMLTETVARRNADGTSNNISLLDAFLNPPSFNNGGVAGQLSADEAAGSIFRGMSRQVGNEIDEFVTPALRSNLLGLPLDLAAINMARARETGVPTLNEARTTFFAASSSSAVRPYDSWTDFGFALRNRESLVNFVAAYGRHPSILQASTLDAKRAAAQALIDPPVEAGGATVPPDAADFMQSTGSWAGKETGLNLVDLWMGGLAEKPMVFGGLLGSTFNYVFEMQMEDLQFGDRFYYLSRTAGLNLLTQLEGNSFAELVMRNTDVEGLPADAFSRPDYVFNLGRMVSPTTGAIVDDPSTEDYNEGDRTQEPGSDLLRQADGTVRYTGPAHVVFNGTPGNDQVRSSEGDDTIRGNDGDDRVEGGDGVDNLIGGLGDDILTDLFGDDTIKGGDGNDAISSGQGFGADLNQGGRGKDFVVSGNDAAETFAGQGDDFVLGGDGDDTIFGDEGDDWVEGGRGAFNLLQGDSGNPFQDDPNGGDDVIDGDGGAQDFDGEGGDDVMLLGPGIQRSEGMLGFDWAVSKGDPDPADSDLSFTGLLPPTVGTLRDRFDMVEGVSGWRHDDVLRGDNGVLAAEGGIGTPEDHALNAQAIASIDGLADLLPPSTTTFRDGNIILGGAGSDTMEGRGGDDVIHGDAWLNVRLRVPDLSTTANQTDTMLVDGMTSTALVENGVDRSLRQLVMAGRINPGDITIERFISYAANPAVDDDTVVYDGVEGNYDITHHADGSTTVEDLSVPPAAGEASDANDAEVVNNGTDTLLGVETLVFSDTVPPGAPTSVTAVAGSQSATVSWVAPTAGAVDGYNVKVTDAAGLELFVTPDIASPGAMQHLVQNLTNDQQYRFEVRAYNEAGAGDWSTPSGIVTPRATVPAAPRMSPAEAGDGQVTVQWTTPDDGGSTITGYEVGVRNAGDRLVGDVRQVPGTASGVTVRGLTNGNQYWFQVYAVNGVGRGPSSSVAVATPGTTSGPARISEAWARDGSAMVRWRAPLDDGGSAVSDYRIQVLDSSGHQMGALRVANAATTSLRVGGLTNGERYRFRVAAVNDFGRGKWSARSNPVLPGRRPGAPVIGRPATGQPGGLLTATATWSPPPGETLPEITGYRVTALQMESRDPIGRVLRSISSPVVRPKRRSFRFELPRGIYRFVVVAWNAHGRSAPSQTSRAVRAR